MFLFWMESPTPLASSSAPSKRSSAAQQEPFPSEAACRQLDLQPPCNPSQVCAYGFSSPLVARLVSSHGARLPCILGAVLAALGIFAASFTTSIVTFVLCESLNMTEAQQVIFIEYHLSGYSVITGIGFGLMYIPSIVIVSR